MNIKIRSGILVPLSLWLLVACGPQPEDGPGQIGARPVRVALVAEEAGSRELRISGVSRATRRAALAFLVSGTLADRPVELGQRVSRGQVLATLYNPVLGPAVDSALARVRELDVRLGQLDRDVRRAEELYQRKLISEGDAEAVRTEQEATRAARDLALASLQEARNRLQQASLLASFDGAINAIYFEPGEYVAAGQPVVQISGTDELEVVFEVPETLIGQFEPGQEVAMELPFLGGRRVAGGVVHVGDAGGEPGALFPVEVRIQADEGLRPGLTVELVMPAAATSSLVIPLAAVLDPGAGRPRVFRLTEGRVEPVYVQIGQLLDEQVSVRGELMAGDEVVVTGVSGLTPGQKVEVLR